MATISQCAQCGKSFSSLMDVKKHIKLSHLKTATSRTVENLEEKKKEVIKPNETTIDKAPTPSVVASVPIKLVYKYIGECPSCKTQVETIEFVDNYLYVLAYCPSCKKNVCDKKVIPIEDQEIK